MSGQAAHGFDALWHPGSPDGLAIEGLLPGRTFWVLDIASFDPEYFELQVDYRVVPASYQGRRGQLFSHTQTQAWEVEASDPQGTDYEVEEDYAGAGAPPPRESTGRLYVTPEPHVSATHVDLTFSSRDQDGVIGRRRFVLRVAPPVPVWWHPMYKEALELYHLVQEQVVRVDKIYRSAETGEVCLQFRSSADWTATARDDLGTDTWVEQAPLARDPRIRVRRFRPKPAEAATRLELLLEPGSASSGEEVHPYLMRCLLRDQGDVRSCELVVS
jgi:hypothetical protein